MLTRVKTCEQDDAFYYPIHEDDIKKILIMMISQSEKKHKGSSRC